MRRAVPADLPAIVDLLRDDEIGKRREAETDFAVYAEAFAELTDNRSALLLVAQAADDTLLGYLQASVIRHLSNGGGRRALLEDIRVAAPYRRQGVGRHLLLTSIDWAGAQHCKMVQLFMDRRRDAAAFLYRSMGFTAAHDGWRLQLGN